MTTNLAPDIVRWVQEGEHLFSLVLETLHRHEELHRRTEAAEGESQRLREEIVRLRHEVDVLKAERAEVAETLKVFADHVTRLASQAIDRLGHDGARR